MNREIYGEKEKLNAKQPVNSGIKRRRKFSKHQPSRLFSDGKSVNASALGLNKAHNTQDYIIVIVSKNVITKEKGYQL